MIKAYFLYTGPDGHSHYKSGNVSEKTWAEAKHISFKETAPGSTYDWHTAPTTQYVLTLAGELEFTTSKGEIFFVTPGEVLIATDTTGQGHKWRIIGTDPWKRAYVKFDKVEEINFTEDGTGTAPCKI